MPEKQKLPPEKRYHRYQLILSITEFVLGLAFLVAIILTGFSTGLENWIRGFAANDYLVLIIFVIALGIMESVLLFPLSFTSGYVLEHRFNLSNQSFKAWMWEKLKGLLIAGPLGLILLIIFYTVLRKFPVLWWFIMGTVMLLFSVVLARLAPILIFPLFYKFEKLKDEELTEKVSSLCDKVGMKLEGVYQFNLSKSTKKGNAAFTGLGKSRRVILGDTLLNNLKAEEILGVLAHELGHFKLKHIWKSMGLGVITTYLGLFLVSVIYNSTYPSIGEHPWTIAALPLMALILTLYEFITSPMMNAYSRSNERAADDFAVNLIGEPESFISGLNKLSDQNLADRTPNKIVEFLFYSHPSIEKRVARLKVEETKD